MKFPLGLAASAVFVFFASSDAQAQAYPSYAYPWCAEFTRGNGTDCAYSSLEQCLATVSAVGGQCRPNAGYLAPPPRSHRPRKG